MKANKYPPVSTVPDQAISVSNYAAQENISVAYVYIKYLRNKAAYKIVNFQGINFVIPDNAAMLQT